MIQIEEHVSDRYKERRDKTGVTKCYKTE